MALCKQILVFFFCVLLSLQVFAQNTRSIVFFQDKDQNSYSLDKPQEFLSERAIQRRINQKIGYEASDLPLTAAYVTGIENQGAQVIHQLKWINAVVVEASAGQLSSIGQLDFVKEVVSYATNVSPVTRQTFDELSQNSSAARTSDIKSYYGVAYQQMNILGIPKLHQKGFHGEGMLVAVFDAGFLNVNTLPAFDSLFQNQRIKATYDLVSIEANVYDNNNHGTSVLSCLAACDTGKFVGGAYRADYLLFRTENVSEETPLEEYYWLKAAEMADSAGADVINSSLGYNTFDNTSYSHTYSQLNGKTTVIANAAILASSKGILVVNSAGNEGASAWHYINTPADAANILAVGAVDLNKNYASFSSVGPSADGRIKPDLTSPGAGVYVASAYGGYITGNGTSYAAPGLAGLAILFWQKFPQLTNLQVIDYLKKSASRFNNPDNNYGYGIPDVEKAELILTNLKDDQVVLSKFKVYPNPVEDQEITLEMDSSSTNLPIHIQLYDTFGHRVFEQFWESATLFNKLNLNCIALRPGCYFFRIIDGHGDVFVQRILKI